MVAAVKNPKKLKSKVGEVKLALGEVVDALGEIKAKIKVLEDEEKILKDALIASGVSEADGVLFHASVSRFERSSVDWNSLKEEYHPPKFLEMIEKHSASKPSVAVKVVSH